MPIVSILIVTYNSGAVVADCLHSILAEQPTGYTLEIIVTDNGSKDGTPQMIRQQFPGVKLVEAENDGFGAGNNHAFAASSGDYVLCVNPDLLLTADAITALVDYLAANPTVGIAGPRILDDDGHVSMAARPPHTPLKVLLKHLGVDKIFPAWVYGPFAHQAIFTQPTDAGWLTGACLALRREVFQRLNGFDDRFFLYYEDTDVCKRALDAGWRVVYVPQATVQHHGNTTISQYPLVRVRHYHRSPVLYFRKHGPAGMIPVLKLGFALELLVKIGFRLVRGQRQRAQAEWLILKEMWWY